jgi:hypothetical protein
LLFSSPLSIRAHAVYLPRAPKDRAPASERSRSISQINDIIMRTPRSAAALFLALACAAAVPAQAQRAFPTLRLGQSVQGRLAASDPAMYERGKFKVYQFRAQPGVRYVATLDSEDFDGFLTLARTVGGVTDYMLSDDDAGGGSNARLRFEVPDAGTYLLVAQALGEGLGAFTIAVDTMRARQVVVEDLEVGRPVRGELTDEDGEYSQDQDGEEDVSGFYDLYRLQGVRPGQRLRIRMEMGEYIPNIAVGTMQNGEFTVVAESVPPGADATSPAVTLAFRVPEEEGEYYVQVGAFGEVTGPYTLTVDDRGSVPAPRTTSIRRGQTVTGTLAERDPELDDGRWYDLYAYTGRAGERIRITMSSDDFDTVVILGRMVDGEFQELGSNDDAEDGDDTDSELVIELPEDGRFVIQATSFEDGTGGEYELTVGSRPN